jgi:hypothetical protein
MIKMKVMFVGIDGSGTVKNEGLALTEGLE